MYISFHLYLSVLTVKGTVAGLYRNLSTISNIGLEFKFQKNLKRVQPY